MGSIEALTTVIPSIRLSYYDFHWYCENKWKMEGIHVIDFVE